MEQILANIGPSAAVVVAIILFLRYMEGQSKSQQQRDVAFAQSLQELTHSNRRVAEATERAADEAKERNGHLAELAIENHRQTLEILKKEVI